MMNKELLVKLNNQIARWNWYVRMNLHETRDIVLPNGSYHTTELSEYNR